MDGFEDLSQFQDAYHSSQTFLIILRSHPSFDQVSAGLALHLALQYKKKEVHTICETPMKVECGNLVAVDQVKSDIGNKSLRISFEYSEESVENVSYDIDKEHNQFHLVVRPRKGHRSLDPSTVQYSNIGLDADMIFMIGVNGYEDIQTYYESEEQVFHQAHTIAIAKSQINFAQRNFVLENVPSYSQISAEIIHKLQLEVNSDIATNLFAGLEHATEGFHHYSVNAETFELCASLMRNGARRIKAGGSQSHTQQGSDTASLAKAFAKKNTSSTSDVPKTEKKESIAPGSLNYAPPVR